MATLTASSCQTSSGGFFLSPPRYIENGVVARSALFTKTAAESAGDVIQMVPIPRGAQILELNLTFGLGGGATTINVGDGNSTGRFAASMSTNVATVQRATAGLGYSYSADDTIDIVIGTATSASAVGTYRLTVFYAFDGAADGNS
jgi:hypothetical protein